MDPMEPITQLDRVARDQPPGANRIPAWRDRDDREVFTSTVTIASRGDRTEITLRSVFDTTAQRDSAVDHGAIEATEQTLGRLAEFVAVRSGDATGEEKT